ncbi:MAG: hypothetical protein ABR551_04495 [Gemmatimonadales bacterium]
MSHRSAMLAGAAVGLATLLAAPAEAQGYRVRLDSRVQGVSWRGVIADSVPRSAVIEQPNGGYRTAAGHAATCSAYWCFFYQPGDVLRGLPWVTQADVAAWGLGIPGLSARANARWATDLGDGTMWPGTEPEFQLVEGYLEYAREGVTARAGRLFLTSRLGAYGLDGVRATVRQMTLGLEVSGYAGWGLARGSVLPVTDPALNPLNDFQPRDRQLAAGAELGWVGTHAEARVEYRREVDPAVDYFVSERAAASFAIRPIRRLTITGGGEYDLAFGHVGSADASATWLGSGYTLSGGIRRYRPFFDLWTIWGAFSPVAYHAWHAAGTVSPVGGVTLRARGERFQFEDTETFTPGVFVEDRGWRFGSGVTWMPTSRWILDGGYQAEFGPGASSRGYDGRVTWLATDQVSLTVHGTQFKRPLELRYNDAELLAYGLDAEYRPNTRWRFGLTTTRYDEQRKRPDAGGVDWDQFRVAARVTWLFGSNADRLPLPRAVRTGAGGDN